MTTKMKNPSPGAIRQGAGRDCNNSFDANNNSRNVLQYPARRYQECVGCGARFLPSRLWHRACHSCWAWHKALTGIELTAAALLEVREGKR